MQTLYTLNLRNKLDPAASRFRFARAAWLCLAVFWLLGNSAGCSVRSTYTDTVATAEAALAEAGQLLNAKQYAPASRLLDQCIASGGLNSDLLSKALVLRAQCLIEQGRLDDAAKDLERALQGPVPLDLYHFIRGQWLTKLGKHNQASREFAAAKKYSMGLPNGH